MQIKVILSVLTLFSIAFLVPTGAFAEITEATVTLEKSLEVDAVPREATPRGLEFNDDGTKMYITGITGLANDANPDIHQYSLSCPWQLTGTCGEEEEKKLMNVMTVKHQN